MIGWRSRWALSKLLSPAHYKTQRDLFEEPGKYYEAILKKFIPGRHINPILLSLRRGPKFFVHEFMTLYIYNEIFVDKVYDVDLGAIDAPFIIDIGANTGLFALYAKTRWPNATIQCYEPYPPNFRQLAANIQANNLDGITFFQKGVGKSCTTATLHVHPTNVGGHSLYGGEPGSATVQVEITDLTTILAGAPKQQCNLLKLDCEGCECEILQNLTPDLAHRISHIVYEPTPRLCDVKQMNLKLSGLGYSISYRNGLFHAVSCSAL